MAEESGKELIDFIGKLEYAAKWYVRSMMTAFVLMTTLRLVVFIAPVVASIVAALMGDLAQGNNKFWVVVLPMIGAAAALFLSQFRFDDFIALQEDYRREYSFLSFHGRQRLASGKEEPSAIHADLIKQAEEHEKLYPNKLKAVVGSFFSSPSPQKPA